MRSPLRPSLDGAVPQAPAVIEPSGQCALTYSDLIAASNGWAERVASDAKMLVFLFARREPAVLTALAGCWEAGHAVTLVDGALPSAKRDDLVGAYRPDVVVEFVDSGWSPSGYAKSRGDDGASVWRSASPPTHVFEDLALLLPTSGTTGSPKLVRLAGRSVQANAQAIASALGLRSDDRAVVSLPLSYTYGLSVLTSHLAAGAALCFTNAHVGSRRFWHAVATAGCTTFAGVPDVYALLAAAGFRGLREAPSVRLATVSGGRLDPDTVTRAAEFFAARGGSFRPMYGQTEATARITCTVDGEALRKPWSAGRPVDGVRVAIEAAPGREAEPGEDGEVVVRGESVMLGYALSRADVGRGDDARGVLRTGDVGRFDAEGSLRITGRTARFVKILGKRTSLDDIEDGFGAGPPVAAVLGADEQVIVYGTGDAAVLAQRRERALADLGLPVSAVRVRTVSELPRSHAGKINYAALRERVAQDLELEREDAR